MIVPKRVMNYNKQLADLDDKDLFKLKCLVKATNIECSAHYTFETREFTAFTTGSADIILYLKKRASLPAFKKILWFQKYQKQICALCFDPSGSYLLSVSRDGSLHIIPALALIDEHYVPDKRWNTMDITSFSSIISQPDYSRPTAIIWWQDSYNTNIGIVGTECGEIIFINLDSGLCIYVEHINEHVTMLHVCENKNHNNIHLLITTQSKQQWRLKLEEDKQNFLNPSDNCKYYKDDPFNDGSSVSQKSTTFTKSKLQEFKQRSAEKFAIFKQKLVETKSQNSGQATHGFGYHSIFPIGSEACSNNIETILTPELLPKGIFFEPQAINFSQWLYTSYDLTTDRITFCGPDLSPIPLPEYNTPIVAESIIFTHRFFFILATNRQTIYVVSSQLPPTCDNTGYKVNTECIMACFSFEDKKEVVRAMYKISDYHTQEEKLFESMDSIYTVPSNIHTPAVDLPAIDTVIVITNHSVYKIILRIPLISVFMHMVLTKDDVNNAKIMALSFGMNPSQLLEYAADILLVNNELPRAVNIYRLARCKLLKTVLKFASLGYTFELLNCLNHCLNSSSISELPASTRMHFSNLCALAFIEVILRVPTLGFKQILQDFEKFLIINTFYDETLIAKIAGEARLWNIMQHLSIKRALSEQILHILIKMVETNDLNLSSYDSMICISEPSLMQAMLLNSDLGKSHVTFTTQHISDFQIFVLQRLLALYDPTNPVLRPRLLRYKSRKGINNSRTNEYDSLDLTDDLDKTKDAFIEEIIETFLIVLLTFIYKKFLLKQYSSAGNMEALQFKKIMRNDCTHVNFRRRHISGGYSHVSLIRNGCVFTWGSCIRGSLGTGPTVLKYGAPRPLLFFQKMQLEVLSVSCGRYHTLTVTNNGIYTWGSNDYGQLGIAEISQCSTPHLITALAEEIIVDAVAGQYHSVALTVDGRVFTWGWGVHGQLGHGNTDKKHIPTLVTALVGTCIQCVDAGYAHTLVLSAEGDIYAFGCNVFGQLGTGNTTKSSTPIKVSLLPEKIILIATGYFHNLAVSQTNKLYVWGASPQMLRIQAQAQVQAHKSRILEHKSSTGDPRRLDNFPEKKKTNDPLRGDHIAHDTVEATAQSTDTQAKLMENEFTSQCRGSLSSLEEVQSHLRPSLVDINLVKGQIIQISAGCHHNALVTKDGSLYTWGRNLDGQIGNGTRREIAIPTQLSYNPAFIFSQVPPRHNNRTRVDTKRQFDEGNKHPTTVEGYDDVKDKSSFLRKSITDAQGHINPTIKTVGVCCGYDYTLAIQPGGTVLAWGNNSRAQLGRMPLKDAKDNDDKLVLLKSSKRIVRIPQVSHAALDTPSQVPDIPAPIISYQSYQVTSLSQCVRSLSSIEESPGDLTLDYVLGEFMGLYDSTKIMKKCTALGNYQACAKIAALQHNLPVAFSFQLKTLFETNRYTCNKLTSKDCTETEITNFRSEESLLCSPARESTFTSQRKANTDLFNKQVEKNLIESAEDCLIKNQMKVRPSRSLNNLEFFEQELFNFDCQGAPEEMCTDHKCDEVALNFIVNENVKPENVLSADVLLEQNSEYEDFANKAAVTDILKINSTCSENSTTRLPEVSAKHDASERVIRSHKNNITNEALKLVKNYLCQVQDETVEIKFRILQNAIDFWIYHDLSIRRLENLLDDYMNSIFYPLGLLLFCYDSTKKYLYEEKAEFAHNSPTVVHVFSFDFCIRVCSMLLENTRKDDSMFEYIKLLSILSTNNYGPLILEYPDASGISSTEQMMGGIISTLSRRNCERRPFIHINELDTVNHLMTIADWAMVFTCGHHFSFPSYRTEVISQMEIKILTSQLSLLPCTAQYVDKLFCQNSNPEIVCPVCVPQALENTIKGRS